MLYTAVSGNSTAAHSVTLSEMCNRFARLHIKPKRPLSPYTCGRRVPLPVELALVAEKDSWSHASSSHLVPGRAGGPVAAVACLRGWDW
jgi:hypothetical protein